MQGRRRKFWGWGWEDEGPSEEQCAKIAALLAARFNLGKIDVHHPPRLDELDLRPPRLPSPARSPRSARPSRTTAPATPTASPSATSCAPFAATSRTRPTSSPSRATRATSSALLDWCTDARAAAIPYGGGSSVVGGVEPPPATGYARRVVDRPAPPRPRPRDRPRLARGAHPGRRARAGARRPAAPARLHAAPLSAVVRVLLARRLDRHALGRPLRHALHAHRRLRRIAARDHAERHRSRSRRLPGSGAGPSPDRLFIGSEGILGIITEAWMRLQDRPTLPQLGLGDASPTSSPPATPCAPSARPGSTRPTAASSTPAKR